MCTICTVLSNMFYILHAFFILWIYNIHKQYIYICTALCYDIADLSMFGKDMLHDTILQQVRLHISYCKISHLMLSYHF